MDLIEFIRGFRSFRMANKTILKHLPEQTAKTLKVDLFKLEQKMFLRRSLRWKDNRSFRIITLVNKTKDLRFQTNRRYLEEIALANPSSFRINWRRGYEHFEGDVGEYLSSLEQSGTTCTGVFFETEPTNLLNKAPLKHPFKESFTNEKTFIEDPRELAF